MPTKRRFIIFLIVLTLMLLIKRAVGQEAQVGWDPVLTCGEGDHLETAMAVTISHSLLLGALAGIWRIQCRAIAERQGRYFTGDLVQLRLR
jgi:hypothetical protein